MIRRFGGVLALLVTLAAPTASYAVQPDEMLKDPTQESRAREISRELRCVVCQNESIDESNADLARDLRLIVRDRVSKGDSNEQVLDFVVARYGDYVLLKPPFKLSTYALWFGPLIFALLALAGGWAFFRRPATTEAQAEEAPPAPLSAAEKKRLEALLRDGDKS